MSNRQLTEIRLFNHSEFMKKSTPRTDKIIMALLDDNLPLKPDDEAYKDLCVQALAIMSKYPTQAKQVKMIGALDGGISIATCYRIIRDTQYIFGNIQTTNRIYLKNAMRERLHKLLTHLDEKKKPDHDLILQVADRLIKLDDLPNALPGNDQPEAEVYIIPSVEFTSDPAALMSPTQSHSEEE